MEGRNAKMDKKRWNVASFLVNYGNFRVNKIFQENCLQKPCYSCPNCRRLSTIVENNTAPLPRPARKTCRDWKCDATQPKERTATQLAMTSLSRYFLIDLRAPLITFFFLLFWGLLIRKGEGGGTLVDRAKPKSKTINAQKKFQCAHIMFEESLYVILFQFILHQVDPYYLICDLLTKVEKTRIPHGFFKRKQEQPIQRRLFGVFSRPTTVWTLNFSVLRLVNKINLEVSPIDRAYFEQPLKMIVRSSYFP